MDKKALRKNTLAGIAGAVAIALSPVSNAATFDFGTLLSGTYQPAGSFATLNVDQLSGSVFNYTLIAKDLNALFNAGAFIGSMANDLTTNPALPTISNISGGGVTAVTDSAGGGPGGNWEFRFDFGGGAGDRLLANETVSWRATFAAPVTYTGSDFALHVQGLTEQNGGSAWYIPTPVPEPQTYAMMLAGLGLLGFARIRRQRRYRHLLPRRAMPWTKLSEGEVLALDQIQSGAFYSAEYQDIKHLVGLGFVTNDPNPPGALVLTQLGARSLNKWHHAHESSD